MADITASEAERMKTARAQSPRPETQAERLARRHMKQLDRLSTVKDIPIAKAPTVEELRARAGVGNYESAAARQRYSELPSTRYYNAEKGTGFRDIPRAKESAVPPPPPKPVKPPIDWNAGLPKDVIPSIPSRSAPIIPKLRPAPPPTPPKILPPEPLPMYPIRDPSIAEWNMKHSGESPTPAISKVAVPGNRAGLSSRFGGMVPGVVMGAMTSGDIGLDSQEQERKAIADAKREADYKRLTDKMTLSQRLEEGVQPDNPFSDAIANMDPEAAQRKRDAMIAKLTAKKMKGGKSE